MEAAEKLRHYDVRVIDWTLNLDTDLFRNIVNAVRPFKAIVVVTTPTGGYNSGMIDPVTRELAAEGIPVFIVSNNTGDDYGIVEVKYEALAESVRSGAIPLQRVNVKHIEEICDAIQDQIYTGKTGAELAQAIEQQFVFHRTPGNAYDEDLARMVEGCVASRKELDQLLERRGPAATLINNAV